LIRFSKNFFEIVSNTTRSFLGHTVTGNFEEQRQSVRVNDHIFENDNIDLRFTSSQKQISKLWTVTIKNPHISISWEG